jgi:uncharacterized protein (DUF1501 family)
MKSMAGAATLPAASSLIGSLLMMEEAAASSCPANTESADYKALVCVYLAGGNDAFNTVLYDDDATISGSNRSTYNTFREGIALPANSVFGLNQQAGFPELALHQQLSFLAAAFNATPSPTALGVAVVGNVGPLREPSTTRALLDGNNELYPPRIYSHNDQTSVWLTGKLEGQASGWGGLVVQETCAARNLAGNGFRSISMRQSSAFCQAGTGSTQVENFVANTRTGIELAGNGPLHRTSTSDAPLGVVDTGPSLSRDDFLDVVKGVADISRPGHKLESLYVGRMQKALANASYLLNSAQGNLTTPHSGGEDLTSQLRMVANFIQSQATVGARRQVFFVQLGGFDTHQGQLTAHDKNMKALNDALGDFYTKLGENFQNKVTTFTASEFGRKLKMNAGLGTDHGWGGHHFVVGGAVNTGFYGEFPALTLSTVGAFTDRKLLPDGTLIPTISVDQYAWELAKWLGVPDDPATREKVLPSYFPPETLESGLPVPLSFMKP